jgi:hypothetical protein
MGRHMGRVVLSRRRVPAALVESEAVSTMHVEEIQSSSTPYPVAGAQFMLDAQRGRYEPSASLDRFSRLGEACFLSPLT